MSRQIPGSRTLVLLALIGLLAVGASHWQSGAVGEENPLSSRDKFIKRSSFRLLSATPRKWRCRAW